MPLDGLSFLVLEDHALIAMDLEMILIGLGARSVELAASTTEALRLVDRVAIHLAILDLNLGKTTSLSVAEALVQRGIPVLFATGYDDRSALPHHLRHIPVARKPYDADQLRVLILGALGRGAA